MRIHGTQPSVVRIVKRQNGIRAMPAGSEMNVRTIGSMRVKNTVAEPYFANQSSAHLRCDGLMWSLRPCFSRMSTRP